MIKVTCSKKGCETPSFVIPVPNTRTSVVYAQELKTKGEAKSKPVAQSEDVATSGLIETNLNRSTESELLQLKKEEDKILEIGVTTTVNLKNKDYLVVYCDSGHKNIVLF